MAHEDINRMLMFGKSGQADDDAAAHDSAGAAVRSGKPPNRRCVAAPRAVANKHMLGHYRRRVVDGWRWVVYDGWCEWVKG